MDDTLARQLVATGNAQGFVDYVDKCSRGGANYKALQQSLQGVFKTSEACSKAVLLECLSLLLSPTDGQGATAAAADGAASVDKPKHNSGLPYLLLDAVPNPAAPSQPQRQQSSQQQRDGTVVAAAVQLLRTCCSNGNLKAALRIAQVFELRSSDVQQQPGAFQQLQDCLAAQLDSGKAGLTSAVGLLMLFQDLATEGKVDLRSLLVDLVETGQEGLAERWLTQLGRDEQEAYVEACLATDRLKAACRAVRTFGLRETFPDVETVYRARAFARLLDRQLWPLAAQFAGSDKALQEQLVTVLADHDPQHAQELGTQWELPAAIMARVLDPEARAAAEATRAAKYHGFALPTDAITLVNDRGSIAAAQQVLSAVHMVGIDVEWKPEGASKAALLQIATEERVFLFDLHTILNSGGIAEQQQGMQTDLTSEADALDACLTTVLHNQACLKLGLELHGDIHKLHSSWPTAAFRNVGPCLDLKDVWVAHLSASNPHASQLRRNAGLSTLCNELLGKPLDKSMQVSDWERRPLSPRQIIYAAQDAHVLITLYHRLAALIPDVSGVLVRKCFSVQAGSMQPGPSSHINSNIACTTLTVPASIQATPMLIDNREQPGTSLAGSTPGPSSNTTCSTSQHPAVRTCLAQAGLLECLLHVPQALSAGPGIATAVAAATALDIPLTQVAKSIALMTTSGASRHSHSPCLVVLRGDQRLDMHKVALVLRVGRKAIRIATAPECMDVFGYPPGCLPPFALPPGVRVLIDHAVMDCKLSAACQQQHATIQQPRQCCADASTDDVMDRQGADQIVDQGIHHSECQIMSESLDLGAAQGTCPAAQSMDQGVGHGLGAAEHLCTSKSRVHHSSNVNLVDGSHQHSCLLYTGAGSHDAVVALNSTQLLHLSKGTAADVSHFTGMQASMPDTQAHASADHASPGCDPSTSPARVVNASSTSQKEPSFLLDTMLGRLCRYLRLCGVDAEIIEQPLPRPEMVRRATASGRVFLTRDMGLAVRQDAPPLTYLLRDDDPAAQLRDVAEQWSLTCNLEARIMTRCNTCNAAAFTIMDPSAAQPLVPPKVFQVVQEFFQCGNCKKVFWMGPKSYAAKSRLESLLGGDVQMSGGASNVP